MKNRLEVLLAFALATGLCEAGFAQAARQSLPSDNTVALVTEESVSLSDGTGLYKETDISSPLDRKVSIRVSNVPISAFLNSITTQAKINFIMSEEFANKKVTASLTKVSVREALDTLLRVHGLTYQRIGKSDSYVVTKRSNDAPDTITKIYTLSYISLQGIGSASSELSNIMPADVSSTSSSYGSGLDTGSTTGLSSGSSSGGDAYSGSSEIIGIVKSMLSPVGKIAVDPRTNKLIITDVAEVFPQVENILAELDIKPPQILIEAQIVEVNKTSGLNLGFEYGDSAGTMLSMTAPSRIVDLDYVRRTGVHGWNFIFPSSDQVGSSSNSSTGTGDGSTTTTTSDSDDGDAENAAGMLSFGAFNIVLKSLLTNGEARYLGKPKVMTLNNKTAIITTSTDAAVGTIMQQSGGGEDNGGISSTSAERKRVGLMLQVTPQVNREGYVTLYVQPSYSNVVSSVVAGQFDTTTRATSTLVRVKNGQTVVIGGLISGRETEQVRKVPLLGDIPILGWLFTSKTKSRDTTDLVIFITPTILAE